MSATLEAYERWAATYPPTPHNPLMRAEQTAMLDLMPEVRGRRVLDLACGSGRYARELQKRGASEVVALDFSPGMLRQANNCLRVRGDMMLLPFAANCFATVVSGLAVGHTQNLSMWLSENFRVLEHGAHLLYSDFHPEAIRAGLSRSFKDENSRTWLLPHHCHDQKDHIAAIAKSGLEIKTMKSLRVGDEFREDFLGADAFYRKWQGLPLILIIKAQKHLLQRAYA